MSDENESERERAGSGDGCHTARKTLHRIPHLQKPILSVPPFQPKPYVLTLTSQLTAPQKGVSLTFQGSSYPDPITTEKTPQSFNLNVYCDTETSQPTFKSYDGKDLWVEWKAPAGCALGDAAPGESDPPSKDPGEGGGDAPPSSSMGSGIGYFFLL